MFNNLRKLVSFQNVFAITMAIGIQSFGVNIFKCTTDKTPNVFKYAYNNTLNLLVDGNKITLNTYPRVWNYLNYSGNNDEKLVFTSATPENFLQNNDLVVSLPESPQSQFFMSVANTTSHSSLVYSCVTSQNFPN